MNDLCFNIRTDEQPDGGFSVVVVFEPKPTEIEALELADKIADSFCEDLGWECGRSQ
jgi:hypothetical protein